MMFVLFAHFFQWAIFLIFDCTPGSSAWRFDTEAVAFAKLDLSQQESND